MLAPTFEQISQEQTDIPTVQSYDPDKGQVIVDRLSGWFEWATGRTWETLPPEFEGMAAEAFQIVTEITVLQRSPAIAATRADFGLISSFSAGPYSETRRSVEDAKKADMIFPASMWASQLLGAICTPERLAEWEDFFSEDVTTPALLVTPMGGDSVSYGRYGPYWAQRWEYDWPYYSGIT